MKVFLIRCPASITQESIGSLKAFQCCCYPGGQLVPCPDFARMQGSGASPGCASQAPSLRIAKLCQVVLGSCWPLRHWVLHPWFLLSFTPIPDARWFWAARLTDDKERAQRSGLHRRDHL